YKRRLAEILLDVGLVALAYYGAYRLRFDGLLPADYARAFEATLGLVIAIKVTVFALCGVYRSIWRYAGIVDLYRIVGAIVISTVAILVYAEWRRPAPARTHARIYTEPPSPERRAAGRPLARRRGTALAQLRFSFAAVTGQQPSPTRETPAAALTVSRARGS